MGTTLYGNVNSITGYTEAFYKAYKAGYEHILQEMKDVYAGKTKVDVIEGENQAYDFVGSVELTEKANRFEDLPVTDMAHNRRWISPVWYRQAIYVDSEDDIALKLDPTSAYIQALAKGVIRKKNDVIYNSFKANVTGGKNVADSVTYSFHNAAFSPASGGGRTIVHDTTNSFAAGGTSTGLTIEKLILAREALVTLKNDPNEIFMLVCGPKQISDLFREAQIQSLDTSPIRALAEGKLMSYHGFEFIVDYNVTLGTDNAVDGTTDVYECYAYSKEGILFAQHESPIFNVDWDTRKQVYQLSARCGMNAIRMDEDKVIKIECV